MGEQLDWIVRVRTEDANIEEVSEPGELTPFEAAKDAVAFTENASGQRARAVSIRRATD